MEPTPKYRNVAKDPIDQTPVTHRAHPDGFMTRQADTPGPYVEKERKDAASEVLYARSEFFELPKDNVKYTQVVDWIANGQAVLRFEERNRRDVPNSAPIYDVWMVYLDVRGYLPTDGEMSEMTGDKLWNRFSGQNPNM